ncbi:MAG: hypothetical protein AB7L91_15390 [Dehalococcoidia bacterium]
MGTSSDFDGGTGGAWTSYKHAASRFASHGGQKQAKRVLARHVAALGGASAAAGSASAGVRTGQGVASFATGLAARGLSDALRDLGLGELVGRDRFEVLEGLLEEIAETGSDLEQVAARNAAMDVLEELYPDDAEDYEDLEAIELGPDDVAALVQTFVSAYVFNRLLPSLAERLARQDDQELARRHQAELVDYVQSIVQLELSKVNPLSVNWRGRRGREIIERLIADAYGILEALE